MIRIIFSALLFSSVALASNYSGDYCHQNVQIKSEGASLYGEVWSGCLRKSVFGYRKTGKLALSTPERIDAIVIGSCTNGWRTMRMQKVVHLGKEWNGTGYMSGEMSSAELFSSDCSFRGLLDKTLEIAYSDGNGRWDSKDSTNYKVNIDALESSPMYKTGNGGSLINMEAWRYLVNQMRN